MSHNTIIERCPRRYKRFEERSLKQQKRKDAFEVSARNNDCPDGFVLISHACPADLPLRTLAGVASKIKLLPRTGLSEIQL